MRHAEGNARAIVHDMRNHLAVAVANLEAWTDGTLAPSPERIRTVLNALGALDALIDRLYAASLSGAGAATDPPKPADSAVRKDPT